MVRSAISEIRQAGQGAAEAAHVGSPAVSGPQSIGTVAAQQELGRGREEGARPCLSYAQPTQSAAGASNGMAASPTGAVSPSSDGVSEVSSMSDAAAAADEAASQQAALSVLLANSAADCCQLACSEAGPATPVEARHHDQLSSGEGSADHAVSVFDALPGAEVSPDWHPNFAAPQEDSQQSLLEDMPPVAMSPGDARAQESPAAGDAPDVPSQRRAPSESFADAAAQNWLDEQRFAGASQDAGQQAPGDFDDLENDGFGSQLAANEPEVLADDTVLLGDLDDEQMQAQDGLVVPVGPVEEVVRFLVIDTSMAALLC